VATGRANEESGLNLFRLSISSLSDSMLASFAFFNSSYSSLNMGVGFVLGGPIKSDVPSASV
jgi:hypothetical protein